MPTMQHPAASSQPHAALTRYLVTFTFMYVVFGTIFAVAIALLKVKSNTNTNTMGGLAVMLAVMPAMSQFVKRQQRAMFTAERLRFAMWATILVFASSAAAYCLLLIATGNAHHIGHFIGLLMSEFRRFPIGGAILLAVSVLVPFAMVYFATGLFGKQALRTHARLQLPR
jgi:hypothetical protein